MTTAHKPTYHPAVGSAFPGGYRRYAPLLAYSSKDTASHTKLKTRTATQAGLPEPSELKTQLEQRESKHFANKAIEKKRQGLIPYADEITPQGESESSGEQVDLSKFDDADDLSNDEQDHSSSSDDEEDEEAELRKELERIKKEREEESLKKKEEEQRQSQLDEEQAVLTSNPLLVKETFTTSRRWDDDVVFKNQARGESKPKKRFINDTIRNDFHRNFLKRYIQ